jgi:hypothetical protein
LDKQRRLVRQLLWSKLRGRGARGFHGGCLQVPDLGREQCLVHMLALLGLGIAENRGLWERGRWVKCTSIVTWGGVGKGLPGKARGVPAGVLSMSLYLLG